MIQLNIEHHQFQGEETSVVELRDGAGQLLGVIYPTEHGVKIVSKHLGRGSVSLDERQPMALVVELR